MNNGYIDIQIRNIENAIKITEQYMKMANNPYMLNCLKMQRLCLKNQISYLEMLKEQDIVEIISPNNSFTMEEIEKYYNGENGKPSYVAVNKIVYDLSNIDSWNGGMHHGLFAGSDLTNEFNSCHYGNVESLKNVAPIVGYIVEKQ